ncbi:hypothetical protein RRSWK_06796 [Rhodopirellula sp. SWK7]|nr:hypothetical protein RRSWK_06796 [Rhodopirellula sp. SWK7]
MQIINVVARCVTHSTPIERGSPIDEQSVMLRAWLMRECKRHAGSLNTSLAYTKLG